MKGTVNEIGRNYVRLGKVNLTDDAPVRADHISAVL